MPVQTLLLAANVLALAVLAYIIYRVVAAARRRAEEDRPSVSDQQISQNLEISPAIANSAPPPISSEPSGRCDEGAREEIAAPVVLTARSSGPAYPEIKEDLPYADPVDGMAFEPGEAVVPCVCGLAYREDSITWLADYHAGCCIHCGAKVDLPKPSF